MQWRDGAALLCGLAFPLGFAPIYLWPVALVSLAGLFWLWRDESVAAAAKRGFLFGIGAFAAGVHWVYVSLETFGGMPPPVAALMVAGFVVWLSVFTALAGAVQALLHPVSTHRWRVFIHAIVVVPAVFVIFEWLRGFGSLGFSWLTAGYSQTESPLAGYAPIAGTFAVSFVTCATAAAVVQVFAGRNSVFRVVAAISIVAMAVAGFGLSRLNFTQSAGVPVKVAAVQGNIPLNEKWMAGAPAKLLAHYQQLTRSVTDAELVVWPESAVPEFIDRIEESVWKALEDQPSDFVIGVLERRFVDKDLFYHNAVISIGEMRSVYRKQHLVPFGEYLPLRPLFAWVLNYLNIPMSDFIPWQGHQALPQLAGHKVGVSICYEDAFARDILPALPEAAILVNVSEDAWFGDSLGPHQRLQMARMRSIEVSRPMIRASNTGVTAVIERNGEVVAQIDQFKAGVVTASVEPVSGSTPFVRFGNTLALLVLFAIVGIACFMRMTRRS